MRLPAVAACALPTSRTGISPVPRCRFSQPTPRLYACRRCRERRNDVRASVQIDLARTFECRGSAAAGLSWGPRPKRSMSATAPVRHLFHWLATKELRSFEVTGQLVPAAWALGGHLLHGCAPAFRGGGSRGRPAIDGWRPRGGHARNSARRARHVPPRGVLAAAGLTRVRGGGPA